MKTTQKKSSSGASAGVSRAKTPGASYEGVPGLKLANILVPVDFSEPSIHALDFAAKVASQYDGRLTLLYVIEPAPFSSLDQSPLVVSQKVLKSRLTARLSTLGKRRVEKERLAAVVVRSGKPFEEIVKAAGELKTDLIIIATHGYTGLKHIVLGSTAERVIRHAPCPVLTVHGEEE